MAPVDVYGFNGYLADALQESSGLIHGYNSQISSFREQLDEADKYAETGYAPVLGGSVLGAIGAALAGGSPGQIAGGAYGAGSLAYNNLELIEKNKRQNLNNQISLNEKLLQDQINFSQQLTGAQLKYGADANLSYLEGKQPGTAPYGIEQQDMYNREMGLAQVKSRGAAPTLSPQSIALLNETTGQDYPKETTLQEGRLGYEMGAELRRKDNQALNVDKFNLQLAQKRIAGLEEVIPGATTPQQKATAIDLSTSYENVRDGYTTLAKLYAQNGDAIFTGPEAAAVGALSSRIISAFRKLHQTGANLTGKEQPMLFTNAPADFDIQGWGAVMEQTLRQKGPVEFIEEANKNLDALYHSSILPLNYASRFYSYSDDQKKRFELDSVFARPPQKNPTFSITSKTEGVSTGSNADKISQLQSTVQELLARLNQ